MPTATGTFVIQMQPEKQSGEAGVTLGIMSLSKNYSGDIEGSSAGNMLTAMTPVEGSADYVAIEQVVGTLAGKSGSFVLTHHGRMHGTVSTLSLSVVPDSGTGKLVGLRGTMTIEREGASHRYELMYEL